MKGTFPVTLLLFLANNHLVVSLRGPRESTGPAPELQALIKRMGVLQLKTLKADCEQLIKNGTKPTCHIGNVAMRREYGSLSKAERLDYVNAVKCLRQKPPRTPAAIAKGAKSRFDDFIVTHIQQTLTIHYTGNFLLWHRWFVYVYERALRNECGYTGFAPYWDWLKYVDAPEKSPIFNGDQYSLGGNGKYIPHNGTVIAPPEGVSGAPLTLAPGLGGGCVETGPFTTINLGPVGISTKAVGPDGGLGYNPRCLERDVGPALSRRYTNATSIYTLLSTKTITEFRTVLEGVPYTPEIGLHGGGHFTINGDPGGDLFTSPGDPAFYLHHAQVDRMYTLWQVFDPLRRLEALTGTNTWRNQPPSPPTTLDDIIELGYAGESIRMGDTVKTTGGPFCYIYI